MFYKKKISQNYIFPFSPMNREFILNLFGEKREIDESQKKVVVQYIQNFNFFGFKSPDVSSRSPLLPKNKYSEKVQKMAFWDIGLQKVSSITLMAKKAGHSAFKNWKKVKRLTNVCLKYDFVFYFNKESEIMNSKTIF